MAAMLSRQRMAVLSQHCMEVGGLLSMLGAAGGDSAAHLPHPSCVRSVLLLVDASIPPMPLDISCAAWFAEAEVGL